MNPAIKTLIDDSAGIYAMPQIFNQLNTKLRDPYASNAQIASIIERDPGLTLSILKIVNSAFYGFHSSISSITQAVSILGRNELSSLVFSTSVIKVFNKIQVNPGALQLHWKHSLLCGLLAKHLALHLAYIKTADSMFVAGLVHDMGRLVIWHKHPNFAELISHSSENKSFQDCETETSALGYTHAEVGAALMEFWEVPELLVATTKWHHAPHEAEKYSEACQIINLANVLAHFDNLDCQVEVILDQYTALKSMDLAFDALILLHKSAMEQLQTMIGMFLP